MWEKDIEQLGRNSFQVNGIRFINHGTHWVKNKKALVLWEIQIPNASSRLASEFAQDLTLSSLGGLEPGRDVEQGRADDSRHINIADRFPTTEGTLHVYYLTSFRVPDVDGMTSAKEALTGRPDRIREL